MSEALAESLQNENQPEQELLVFEVKDRHWRDKANCLDVDPDEFFMHTTWRNPDPTNLRGRYCDDCPVKSDCLAIDILSGDIQANVQGGLLESERLALRKRYVRQQAELKKAAQERALLKEPGSTVTQLPQQDKVSTHIYEPDDREISHMQRTINCSRPVGKVPLTRVSTQTSEVFPVQNALKKPQLGIEAARLLMAQGSLRAQLLANTRLLQSLSELSMITDTVDQDQVRRLSDNNIILALQLDDYTFENEYSVFDHATHETAAEAS